MLDLSRQMSSVLCYIFRGSERFGDDLCYNSDSPTQTLRPR